MNYLLIGAGLIGKKLAIHLSKNSNVVVIDPFSEKIEKKNIKHYKLNFQDFQNLNVHLNEFDAIVNLAYPKKRDYKVDNFPPPDIFLETVNSHLKLNYSIMYSSKKYLNKKGGVVISAGSIYSINMPRKEIYKNSLRTTPVDYISSKSSIIYMSKYFAKNYSNKIYFNTISFGGVFNKHENEFVRAYGKFTKSKSMLKVNEVIESIKFLLNSKKNKINGINLIVDDGFTL